MRPKRQDQVSIRLLRDGRVGWDGSGRGFDFLVAGAKGSIRLVSAGLADRLVESHEVFDRDARLNVVDRVEDEPAAAAEDIDPLPHLAADVFGRAEGERFLGITHRPRRSAGRRTPP